MILTCDLQQEFTQESFQKITTAFDYNNNIYSFDIDLSVYLQYKFHSQLDETNLGQLNITYFSFRNAELTTNLFGEGAFSGSVGSITNITIERLNTNFNANVDLGAHVLHPACSTLKSLKIEQVSQLSSTTLALSPKLEEVSFKLASFPILPSSLFSAENVPNIHSITVGVSGNLNLQTDAFKDLERLTELEISASKIEIIQSYAFNNLPSLTSLELSDINIVRIEEDAFKDLHSLQSLMITSSDIEELPRIFSNSPNLTEFSLTRSKLKMIEENAFSGVPSLESP